MGKDYPAHLDMAPLLAMMINHLTVAGIHSIEPATPGVSIEHRVTKPEASVEQWTARADEPHDLKEATAKRFHYDGHDQLRTHLESFVAAYNFGRRATSLTSFTPYEFTCKRGTSDPERFILNRSINAGTKYLDRP